jgi:hypothetical protein
VGYLPDHIERIDRIGTSPDGNVLFTVTSEMLRIWSPEAISQDGQLIELSVDITNVTVSADGAAFEARSVDLVQSYDLSTGRPLAPRALLLPAAAPLDSPDREQPGWAVQWTSDPIAIRCRQTGEVVARLPTEQLSVRIGANLLASHPDGRTWARAHHTHLYVFRLEGGRQVSGAQAFQIYPDGVESGSRPESARRDPLPAQAHPDATNDELDVDACRAELEQVLAERGEDDPSVSECRYRFADALQEVGDWTGARLQLEHAIAAVARHLGMDHPRVALLRSSLGNVLLRLGEISSARRLFEQAIETWSRTGEEDVNLGFDRMQLALVSEQLGDRSNAEAQVAEALRIASGLNDHPVERQLIEEAAQRLVDWFQRSRG